MSKLSAGIPFEPGKEIEFKGVPNKENIILSGRDCGAILQDIIVNPRIFADTEISELVKSLVIQNANGSGITTNNVNVTTTTVDKITFNNISLFDALVELSEIAGYYFFIDINKDLNFIQKNTVSSGETFGNIGIKSPIAHYKMNDNSANTTVIDSAGSNNGTASFNTADNSVAGKINNALSFDGIDDIVNINKNDFVEQNFSISLCIFFLNSIIQFCSALTGSPWVLP